MTFALCYCSLIFWDFAVIKPKASKWKALLKERPGLNFFPLTAEEKRLKQFQPFAACYPLRLRSVLAGTIQVLTRHMRRILAVAAPRWSLTGKIFSGELFNISTNFLQFKIIFHDPELFTRHYFPNFNLEEIRSPLIHLVIV